MNIGKFSIENPVLVNILMVALFVLGAITLSRMPKEQYSEVPFFFAFISVPWPGVSAQEIEQDITIDVENEMQGLDSLDEITSISSEGLSLVTVRFDDGISKDKFDRLFQDVNTRFSRITLPEGTLQARIESFSSNDFAPVLDIVLSGDVGYPELVRTAEMLENPLLRIPEVKDVELLGLRDSNIIISIDKAALETRNISLNDLVRAVNGRHVNVPGGTMTTKDGDYIVRTVGEMSDLTSFGEIIIKQSPQTGASVRLRDVAKVSSEYDEDGIWNRYNGQTAVTVRVTKVPRGSTIGIIEGIMRVMGERQGKIPADIKIAYQNDQSYQISTTIKVLLNNAFFGLIFLVLILYLFIGLRNAIITALGIPVAFAVTFILLDLAGQTFNTNTLFGLVLVLGMVVDHAIVITENCFRYRQMGMSLHESGIRGTNQVAIPVLAATATTLAAFLPLMILPGTIGKFLRVVPLTVSIALAASTAEALIFLPSHYVDWFPKRKTRPEGRAFSAFRRGFRAFMEVAYRRKWITVLCVLGIIMASFVVTPLLKQDLFSSGEESYFNVDIFMPPGTARERTQEVVNRFEDIFTPLVGNGEIIGINTSVGFVAGARGDDSRGPSVAQIIVDTVDNTKGEVRPISAIMGDLRKMSLDIPGPDKILFRKAVSGPPQDDPVVFRLFGDNYDELLLVADRIRSELAKESEIFNIQDNYEAGTPQLVIHVNEERAASYGLSVSSIGQYIRASVEGLEAAKFFSNNQSKDVIVRFANKFELDPMQLSQLRIPTGAGISVPFSAVATVETGSDLASIKRLDGRREITVSASSYADDNVPQINKRIQEIFTSEYAVRYPGMEMLVGGEFAEFNNLLIQILQIFLIGIFLIYVILGAQFKSYFQPFLIMFSVPLAFAGSVLYLVIFDVALSIPVIYSVVALAGIAVNDAIVLISFINEQRVAGLEVSKAVLVSTETRLRPIILTSITTIAGLTPTALGIGGKSVVWGPMAGTIIFGLLFSTLGTLVFIPAFYGVLFDRSGRKRRRKKNESETPAISE